MLHNLDLIVSEGAELGLHLNHLESEIICSDHVSRGTLLCTLPNACMTDLEKVTILVDISCISACYKRK